MDIRKFPSALTKGFLGFAGLMTVAALGVHLSSYGPDQIGPSLMNFALALFPIVFLVFGPVVVIVAFARIPVERLMAGLPVYVNVFGGAGLLFVFVGFFLLFRGLPGQP